MSTLVFSMCLLSWLLSDVSTQQYRHNIYINPLVGNDTQTCHTLNSSQYPCKTLNYALEYRNDSTRYTLTPNLTHKLTESVPPFMNLRALALVGDGSMATVSCEDAGLAFVSVFDITFADIAFLYCSETRNSTSRNFFRDHFSLYQFQVGLYFYLCQNVEMTRVNVSFSVNATGVVMYDTTGTNVIEDSVFANNSVQAGELGGGGFYVEFSYCVPGDDQCNDTSSSVSNVGAFYSFSNCTFAYNSASNLGSEDNATYIVPYRSSHQAFGRGGGLSIFVKGTAKDNSIEVTDCHFEGNSAQWGGGMFVEFHDETVNNTIRLTNCTLTGNSCSYTLSTGTGGGGMRIGHYVYNYYYDLPLDGNGNRIEVILCNFTSNSAMYGGGLSLSPTLQGSGRTAIVRLEYLHFTLNTGKIGAAVHVGIFHLLTRGFMMDVTVLNCTFQSNTARYADLINRQNDPHTEGAGAVYLNQVPVIFQGWNLFDSNSGSALVVAGSHVDLTETLAIFSNNIGYRGGAISLLGSTYILIDSNTRLYFSDNIATNRGGAIFNRYIEMDNLMTQPNCFIKHVNPFLNSNEWGAIFFFSNNTDHNGYRNNAIHTTSILPCTIAGGNGYNIIHTGDVFCWENWTYLDKNLVRVNGSQQVTTEAGSIKFLNKTESISGKRKVRVIPGKDFLLPLTVHDDYGTNLVEETVFSSTAKYNNSVNKTTYFWGRNATLRGEKNLDVEVTLDTLADRIWHVSFVAEIVPCPPGLKPTEESSSESRCVCSSTYLDSLSCDPDTLKAKLNNQNWIGKLGNSDKYYVGPCPPSFCRTTESSYVDLPTDSSDLSHRICNSHRTGIMCGECVPGYGPAVNSLTLDCVNCTHVNLGANIAKYVASIYLPLAALFTVLILFDIRLTTGPANAFILYCQVVSSTFSLDADGQIPLNRLNISTSSILKGYTVIYGIFNLEFAENLLSPFCFSRHFNALTVFLLDYGVALFPLFMIIVVVVCLKIKERCSFSERIGRNFPFRKWRGCGLRNVNEALLPAFAAFILLSYTKFSLTSSNIITSRPLIDEDGVAMEPWRVYSAGQLTNRDTEYTVFYLLPSSLVFATFVCITPLLLLSYPLTALEWGLAKVWFLWRFYPIDKIHVILDTFQGCYRNRMRFFAGLYFLFRLVIYVAYLTADTWLQQFVVQQIACVLMVTLVSVCRPYNKENWLFNYVDAFIFSNLAVVNALSLYLYSASGQGKPPPFSAFVFQYILVFLPLLYILIYMAWYLVTKNQWGRKKVLLLTKLRYPGDYQPINGRHVGSSGVTRTELDIDDLHNEDEDEAIFARAKVTNRYRGRVENPLEVEVDSLPPSSLNGAEDTRTSLKGGLLSNDGSDVAASNGYGSMSTGISSSAIVQDSSRSEMRVTDEEAKGNM